MRPPVLLLAIAIAGLSAACAQTAAPILGYEVVRSYPHDPQAFTQGLLYLDGTLYEGTGLEGQSSVRRVQLETGRVEQMYRVPARYFGEGLVAFGDKLIELTWQDGVAFVYDRASFRLERQFEYSGEGWGLTTDGKRLILSDGSRYLRFFDPATYQETGRITVTDNGRAIESLNELEYIDGEIWANIWQTDRIARIDPANGIVKSFVDLRGLLPAVEARGTDVLNGIAYDPAGDRIFVTGKLWPRIFEIKVKNP